MPIRVVCPNGHQLRVKDKLAGKQGNCPTCQAAFLVPPASADPPAVESPPPPAAEAIEWRMTLPGGEQFGPTVPTVFAQWISAGRVPADALVWRTGWADWRTARDAAAELPAPLPATDPDRANADLPAGVTLPPKPTEAIPEPAKSEPVAPSEKPNASLYSLRKRRQARRRRNLAISLGVACVALVAMLVWLLIAGPPSGAPVIPAE